MITEFIAVRHGETNANLDKVLQGQLDTDLNPLGIRQAGKTAERLSRETLDHIFSSDLSRAMKTAELIAAPHHLPVVSLRALREWNLGSLQGRKWDELRTLYPGIIDAFKQETANLPVPGGESRLDFCQRVADCLDELADRYAGKRILLVAHGGSLKAMFRHIVGPVSEHSRLPLTSNASVSAFRHIDGFWQLISWNDTAHLRDLGENESVVF